jgi:SprT-like family
MHHAGAIAIFEIVILYVVRLENEKPRIWCAVSQRALFDAIVVTSRERPDHPRNRVRMLTAEEFRYELSRLGARGLSRVSFRDNRSTIWSLTQGATVLNLHAAYRAAPPELLAAFAIIVEEGGVGSTRGRRAGKRVYEWPALQEAIASARAADEAIASEAACSGAGGAPAHCCATAPQRAYLTALFSYLNATRFDGMLPDSIPVRLSSRMRSALGHMLPGGRGGEDRRVLEIALNVDLLLPGNGPERLDTLLHEMAHAADYLKSGHRSHGPSWRAWARRVGCTPTTLYERPVCRRSRSADPTERVPPLPFALRPGIG